MKSRTLAVLFTSALVSIGVFIGCSEPQQASKEHDRPMIYSRAPHSSMWNAAPFYGQHAFQRGMPASDALASSAGEELWVIARPKTPPIPGCEVSSGCGSLRAKGVEEKEVPLPLKHTDVKASISGYVATVDVTQAYHNPYDSKIEAVYVFPLPDNAAVNEFLMTVGERRIRGIIREREEAEKIYAEARRQGYVASLLTQERPNIFTQSVANIEPGEDIDINIKYFNTLAYRDGAYEFVFPMVVGPRFNPPGSTQGVGAVPRGQQGASGQSTEVQYLKPGERSGHDIALSVSIDAGVAIKQIKSSSHVIHVDQRSSQLAEVSLSNRDSIPNKDFVLRYTVAGSRIESGILTHQDKRGGYFTLMLYPPAELRSLERHAMEMIFVLDCSGSMNGQPIIQAKKAIERSLKHLRPDDTFQIIRFSNNASQLGPTPLKASGVNVRKGLAYLESLKGSGGTMMIEGIKAALDFPHDENRLRFVCFMTDGYIGNEAEILAEVHKRLGASRIFSFGVGSSPNRYLLDRMASIGNGAAAYLGLQDSAAEVMDGFFQQISHPAMIDLEVDWGGMQVSDVYPSRVPDLFVGRPVTLTGRFNGNGNATVRVRGKAGNATRELLIPATFGNESDTHTGLPLVWARHKIADLANRATYERNPDLHGQIKETALEYGLMSAYTSFVAVDSLTKTEGTHGTTVAVPVPVPEGVRYETTVSQ